MPLTITEVARLGGLTKSKARAAASRANGLVPCGPGKKRGWPKGKPRKIKPETNQEQKETKP